MYSLLKSEARHFMDYITLAESVSPDEVDERLSLFSTIEQELIEGQIQRSSLPQRRTAAVGTVY